MNCGLPLSVRSIYARALSRKRRLEPARDVGRLVHEAH